MTGATASDLAADVRKALVALVDTLTRERDAAYRNSGNVAIVRLLRRALAAEAAHAEANRERENDAWAARESVRVAHDALVAKEAAEAALLRLCDTIHDLPEQIEGQMLTAYRDARRALAAGDKP